MKRFGRLALAAAMLVPAGVAASTSAGAAVPTATCSGTAGTVGIAPGLRLVNKNVQDATIGGAIVACTGGYVTAGTITSVVGAPLRTTTAVNCQDLLNGIVTKTPLWKGRIRATWTAPTGMGKTFANIAAYVTSSTGTSTSFHYYGDVPAQLNLFSGRHVSGNITIDKGLNSVASGGNCTVLIPITGAGITASSLKIS